ncbi:MAG TPA: xylose isomerase, partial [Phnomibacter sp.]|nr:xylose isomerase [Phnomibacter sp.]
MVSTHQQFLPNINSISYEGLGSDNLLSYQWYNPSQIIAGKSMQEHLRFACAYWHSFCGSGADPFGEATHLFPWDEVADPVDRAKYKMDAAFEFMSKLGLPFYCFHDVDVVDYGNNVAENERRLQALVNHAKQHQQATGIQLLWGTANLFSHKRYMNGASTNPDFAVLTHAGAQV